jgi:hypothetical protein
LAAVRSVSSRNVRAESLPICILKSRLDSERQRDPHHQVHSVSGCLDTMVHSCSVGLCQRNYPKRDRNTVGVVPVLYMILQVNFGENTFRAFRWPLPTKASKMLELAANFVLCHASSQTERREPPRGGKRRKPKMENRGVGEALGRSGTQSTRRRCNRGGSGRTTSAMPGDKIEEISWCSASRS